MRPFRLITLSLATSSVLLLAACESEPEKAERFFQSGLTLVEEGDKERALLEFRNVFEHDPFHREARVQYAQLSLELGRSQDAYGQYLRLIEQYPDATDARVALAQMAITSGSWDEVERHTTAAIAQAPEQPDVQALDLVLRYRTAIVDEDRQAEEGIAEQAVTLIEQIRSESETDNRALVRLVVDYLLRSETPLDALPVVDEALLRDPEAEDLNMIKVQLLERSGDIEATGVQLRKMVELYPDNTDIQQAQISWFLFQDDIDGAVTFLRSRAGADDGPTEGHVAVIQLLAARKSIEAARAELERLAQANDGTDTGYFYNAMLLRQDFESGGTEQAITDLRALVAQANAGEQRLELQILLAQMLTQTDAFEEADALIAAVLEEDTSNVPALKMQASRLIDQDQPGAAVIALRRALSQDARDVETLTIMARAHQRDGDTELAGERLALAVEASGSAPDATARYAQFLMAQDQLQVATNVLEDSRRRNPRNAQILALLGSIALQDGAWQKAGEIIEALRALNTDNTNRIATELEAAVLQGQDRLDDSLSVLEARADEALDPTGAERIRSVMLIVQTQIRAGKTEAARSYLDRAMVDLPDTPDLKVLDATLHALEGNLDTAEEGYRALIAQYPESFLPVRLLINVLNSKGAGEDAAVVLEEAAVRMPENAEILLNLASRQEAAGDIDGAIATYERIYARDSSNLVVANNLASLITTFRDDEESLTRASSIARRLRGSQLAPFQDTYGWIAYRRGNMDEALEYLEPASEGMPNNPLVQYHLGMTYVGLGRTQDAITQLNRALELGEGRDLPQMQEAREALEALKADGTE